MTWPVRIAQLTAKESLTLKVFLNFSSTAQNEAHDRAAAIAILASFFSSESGCSFLKPPAHTILLDRSFAVVFPTSPQGMELLKTAFKHRRVTIDGKVFEVARFSATKPKKTTASMTTTTTTTNPLPAASVNATPAAPPTVPIRKKAKWFPPPDEMTKQDTIATLRSDLSIAQKTIVELTGKVDWLMKISNASSKTTLDDKSAGSRNGAQSNPSANFSVHSAGIASSNTTLDDKSATSGNGAQSNPSANFSVHSAGIASSNTTLDDKSATSGNGAQSNPSANFSVHSAGIASTTPAIQPASKKPKGMASNAEVEIDVDLRIVPRLGQVLKAAENAECADPEVKRIMVANTWMVTKNFPVNPGKLSISNSRLVFRSFLSEKVLEIPLGVVKTSFGKTMEIAIFNENFEDGLGWLVTLRFPTSEDEYKGFAEKLIREIHSQKAATMGKFTQNCAPARSKLEQILREKNSA
jgi:hypothetical protein